MAERETLREGSTGDLVRDLQQTLKALGFDPGEADGVFGSRTVSAVTAFQSLHGVHVDNVVGPVTWMTLDSAVADRSAL